MSLYGKQQYFQDSGSAIQDCHHFFLTSILGQFNFTWPYISIRKDDNSDPKLSATSQELIGILKEEYIQRQR